MNNKIYTDKAGYEQYLKELDELKQKLSKIKLERFDDFNSKYGDELNTAEFEENERLVHGISYRIQQLENILKNIVIVENDQEIENEIVSVGSYVDIERISNNSSVKQTYKLVAISPNISSEIQEISINSPLGSCIYKHRVGEELQYSVNGRTFFVKILKIESKKEKPVEEIEPGK